MKRISVITLVLVERPAACRPCPLPAAENNGKGVQETAGHPQGYARGGSHGGRRRGWRRSHHPPGRVSALGGYAGSVVVVDPANGRVLSMVNQKLALQTGFIPCSTVKLVTSLAALTENLVNKGTIVHINRYLTYTMTQALARSNNQYFQHPGHAAGLRQGSSLRANVGLREKAGLDIPGEQAGVLPEAAPPNGVGMMTASAAAFP